MTTANELAKKLQSLDVASGMDVIDQYNQNAINLQVYGDTLMTLHKDGSISVIENMGGGKLTVASISSDNVFEVINHYKPFADLWPHGVQ